MPALESTDLKGTERQGGAAAPDPAAYGLSPPLFQPLTAYAARGRIFPAPARGTPHPGKPICKRDATRPAETEKMQFNVDDYLLDSPPGQVAHQRPAETPKDRCVMPHNPARAGREPTATISQCRAACAAAQGLSR